MHVFGEYFPMIISALQECGIESLRSFVVLATNAPRPVPKQGALTHVPTTENFTQFHEDPRFIKARPIRNEAMEFLTDGNFFNTPDLAVSLNSETDYALIITEGNPLNTEPLLTLAAAADSTKKTNIDKSMTLHLWSETAEEILNDSSDKAEVFKIRFNPEMS